MSSESIRPEEIQQTKQCLEIATMCCLHATSAYLNGDETPVRKHKTKDSGFLYFPNGTLAIDGSNQPRDWVINAQSTLTDNGFHAGFHKSARRIKDVMHQKGIPIPERVVGHSKGGGVAIVLADLLDIPLVVTYASPMAMRADTVLRYNLQRDHINVINVFDPVPKLPLKSSFAHSGFQILLDDGRNTSKFAEMFRAVVPFGVRLYLQRKSMMQDHGMEFYSTHLLELSDFMNDWFEDYSEPVTDEEAQKILDSIPSITDRNKLSY